MPSATAWDARELDVAALGRGEPWVIDGLLGADAAAAVRASVLELASHGELRPAGMGRGRTHRDELRSDANTWIEPSTAEPRLLSLVESFEGLRRWLNREAYLGLRRFEIQAALYQRGSGYVRHRDAFSGGPSRRVTAIYYANPQWRPEHGGALACWSSAGPSCIEPRADRLVVFLSEALEHEVQPVAQGPRVAVTAWYWGP